MNNKKDIRKLSLEQLTTAILEMKEPKFRAKQIYEWLWKKSAVTFEQMTNLSKKLREGLNEHFVILPISTDLVQYSDTNCAS